MTFRGALEVVSMYQHEMSLSKVQQEKQWRNFLAGHGSNHSERALTLAHIINRCEREGVGYRLTALPGMGYYLEKQDMEHLKR